MANGQLGTVMRHIRQLAVVQSTRELSDGPLLERFAAARDQAAFAALVQRYGRLVWSVCRHVLGHDQDAEDSFQATFLVLAQRAASIRRSEAVSSWLHGVAYRVAMKAKRDAARRRARERAAQPTSPHQPFSETGLSELQAVLDEEVHRLPEKLRAPFVLCCLEGKTTAEAAQLLRWKVGTVSGRLSLARKQLQRRLTHRGLALSAALCALSISRTAAASSVPAGLTSATVRAALAHCGSQVASALAGTGVTPVLPRVAALAQGVTKTMMLSPAKIVTAGLIILTAGLAGAGLVIHQALAAKETPTALRQPQQPRAKKEYPKEFPPTSKEPRNQSEQPKPATADKDSFTYSGQVLGPDGKPFAGAKLYLAVPEELANSRPVRAKTGADGRFRFTVTRAELKLPPEVPADVDVFASLEVVAVAEGFGPDWTPPPNPEGERPKGELSLRLVKNDVTINGHILDLQGKPVAGAKVDVLRLETTSEDDLTPFLKAWKTDRSYLPLNLLTKVYIDPTLVGLPKTVTTNADGRFRLPGAGNERIVMLSVEAPLIEKTTFRVLPRSEAEMKSLVQAPDENMMRLGQLPPPAIYGSTFDHFGMPARMITGRVRDQETGKPLAGIRIDGHPLHVSPSRIGPRQHNRAETYTDKDGTYQLKGLGKGDKYQLFAWPGDFSPYIPGGKEIAGSEGLATLKADFELMRGVEVRGHVTDKLTGKPVAASVSYRPGPGNTHPGAAYFRMVGKACDGPKIGTFREMVPPGTGVFLVTVRSGNDQNPYTQARLDPADKAKSGLDQTFGLSGVNAYRVLDVPADAKSVTCEIEVDPGRTLTGTVLGPDGKPLSGAKVKGLTAVWPKSTTLKDGTFTVAALGPGESRELLFVEPKQKLASKLIVRGDDKGDLTVRLEPWAAVTGRILDEDGQPLAGVRIQFSFHHPTFFQPVTWWVSQMGEEVKTDGQGRFRAEGITPGMKFRLHASSKTNFLTLSGGAKWTNDLSARPGETKDLGDLKAKPQ